MGRKEEIKNWRSTSRMFRKSEEYGAKITLGFRTRGYLGAEQRHRGVSEPPPELRGNPAGARHHKENTRKNGIKEKTSGCLDGM